LRRGSGLPLNGIRDGGIGTVKLDSVRRHRTADIVLLVCVIGLALTTWTALSRVDGISAWRVCFGISATMFLALAAVTPHEPWAIAVQLAMSGWLVMAPWLLAFAEIPLARWSHLLTGSVIALLSTARLMKAPAEKHLAGAETPSGLSTEPAHVALGRMWS
jgi:hypothetical protein